MIISFARPAAVAALIICLVGCNSDDNDPPASVPETTIFLSVPLELSVKQRTTIVVPGSKNRLSLTIDDITDNQVMVSLGTDTGETPIPMRSLSPQDRVAFKFAGQPYSLRLDQLDNALIGEDMARFSIVSPEKAGLSEHEKIDLLIEAVAKLEGATFIRNDTEHSAAEAAEHLRTKWEATRDQVTTARQFIDEIASKSSFTGELYRIRLADGNTIIATEFLNDQLTHLSNPQQ